MKTKTYRTRDRTGWGTGPWDDEPDKVQWPDAATGLPCLAVRGREGAWCGYVGVARDHPLYGCSHGDAPCFDVHGGLSFSGSCRPGDEARAICHVPDPGEPDDVWWLGFDCGHAFDWYPGRKVDAALVPQEFRSLYEQRPDQHYRTLAYVQAECSELARQIAGARLEGRRMKHAVESLDGALLDAAVAKAEGWERGRFDVADDFYARPDQGGEWWIEAGKFLMHEVDRWHPSGQWAHGGPLIERERIDIEHISNRGGDPWDDDNDPGDHPWRATAPCSRQISPYGVIEGYGDTPLVAAMRAYVASRFGTEVEL